MLVVESAQDLGSADRRRHVVMADSVGEHILDDVWADDPPEAVESDWINSMDNFAAALRTGAPLACDGREGRRSRAILDAMYESAYKHDGAWLEVQTELTLA